MSKSNSIPMWEVETTEEIWNFTTLDEALAFARKNQNQFDLVSVKYVSYPITATKDESIVDLETIADMHNGTLQTLLDRIEALEKAVTNIEEYHLINIRDHSKFNTKMLNDLAYKISLQDQKYA